MSKRIKVIVADDHPLVLKGFVSLLSYFKEISVVGTAKNGSEVLEILKTKRTDILLLDLSMPVMDGFKVIETVKKNHPNVRIIVVTVHSGCEMIADLIKKGINAFINKSENIEIVLRTINGVIANEFFFDNNAFALAEQVKRAKPAKNEPSLSSRQVEILKMIAGGKSHKNIANTLNITIRTVDYHKANLYKKLNIKSNAQLALYAKEHGFLSYSGELL